MNWNTITEMRLDLFASQVAMNYFDYKLSKIAYSNVSQHCMQFSDGYVYDSIKIELISDDAS